MHPFEGTPQYEQVYGNAFGPPIGYPGNGLGAVRSWLELLDGDTPQHEARPSNHGYRDPDESYEDDELTPENQAFSWLVYELMKALTDKQQFVLSLRMGLRDGICYRQDEVAGFMGVTQQAVADHEAAIERKAQKVLVKSGLGWGDLFS